MYVNNFLQFLRSIYDDLGTRVKRLYHRDDINSNRRAFIVGNYEYKFVDNLKNPGNDVADLSDLFSRISIDTCVVCNSTRDEFAKRLKEFCLACKQNDDIIFYYCGHAIQVDGENYIVPVDANIKSKSDFYQLISLSDVIGAISERFNTKIIFLDACRDNPFLSVEQIYYQPSRRHQAVSEQDDGFNLGRGLASIQAGSQTFIAFAASPGQVAYDGAGRNSIYTGAMLKHIPIRAVPVDDLSAWVGKAVQDSTRVDGVSRQIPWRSTNMHNDFYFIPPSLKPVYELSVLAMCSGLLVAVASFGRSDCYHPVDGLGIAFGAVLGVGIWKWGRRSWRAVAVAVAVTTLAWFIGGLIIDKFVLDSRLGEHCEKGLGISDLEAAAYAALAGFISLGGTLLGGALSSRALRSVTAWSNGLLAGSIAIGLVYMMARLVQEVVALPWLNVAGVYAATMLWFGALGASIGYAFATYIPKGPDPE